MGCCISHDKISTIEVVLDQNGVARRVAAGQGTHLIRTYPGGEETKMERKQPTKPSELSSLSRPQAVYYPAKKYPMSCFPKKVSPVTVVVSSSSEDVNEKN